MSCEISGPTHGRPRGARTPPQLDPNPAAAHVPPAPGLGVSGHTCHPAIPPPRRPAALPPGHPAAPPRCTFPVLTSHLNLMWRGRS